MRVLNEITQAVVLVGGTGMLGAEAAAPPLLPMDEDRVFLDHLLFHIARHGFTDVVLLAGLGDEQIVARYDARSLFGATIQVVVAGTPADAAGALRQLGGRLAACFLLCDGDTLFDFNLRDLCRRLLDASHCMAALALRRAHDPACSARVEMTGDRITAFAEKPLDGQGEALVYGGVAVMRREILSVLEARPVDLDRNIFAGCAERRLLLGALYTGHFTDVGAAEASPGARTELTARWRRPTVFFDRDGVLNRDRGYTYRIEDLLWMPGAMDAVRRVNEAGALAIVVSNQSGIARGLYGEDDVRQFHAEMTRQLAREGAHIDAFLICPFHPEAKLEVYRHPDHPDRKPNGGMIRKAMAQWPVDPARAVLIGDQKTDVEAARQAGIVGLLTTGDDLMETTETALALISAKGG